MQKKLITIISVLCLMAIISILLSEPVAAQYLTRVRNWYIADSTLDNCTIGGTTAGAGSFSTLAASGAATLSSTVTAAGLITANGGVTLGAGDDLIGSSTSDITMNTNKFTVAGDTGNTLVAGTLTTTGLLTANGGVTLGAGDDLIGSATSDITINTTAFTVAGATGNTSVGGTLDVTGALTVTGAISGPMTSTVEVFDANDTLTAAESGKVCVAIGHTGVAAKNQILTLPPAAAGLRFTFVDANATAADDLWITAGTGDTINGGTADKSFKNTGDVVNASCVFECRDATDWIAIPSAIGTWANDNN